MHWHKCATLADCITQSDDPLISIVKTTPTPIQCHIMKHLNHPLGAAPELTDTVHLCKLKKMLLHRQFFVQKAKIPQVDADWSTRWLTKAQGQDKSGPVCGDGTNIGDKQG
eukprot:9914228-Ditylum_brightwellii.AAC.1